MNGDRNPRNDVEDLVSIIANAAKTVETYLKAHPRNPSVPSLSDTESHPLDDVIYPLDIKHAVQSLEGACAQLCATLVRPSHTILNKNLSVYRSASMGVVLRAKVADVLLDASSGMPISEIGKRCGIEPTKLGRILRLLCSQHIFREVSADVFANNRLSMQFLSSNPMWNVGMHLSDEPTNKAAAHLADTLLDPEWGHSTAPERSAFNRSTGSPYPLWLYFEGKDNQKAAEQGARFARAMLGWNTAADADAIVTEFPWEKLPEGTTVNDVGGGWGQIAMQLYKKHPNLTLKLQDLPERVQEAEHHIWPRDCPEAISTGRIQFKGLDLIQEPPIPDCDVYLMKNVLHALSDDVSIKVLVNVSKAMSKKSRLLIHEHVIQSGSWLPKEASSDTSQAPTPLLPNYGAGRIRQYYLDLGMMTTVNGAERTLMQYVKLGEAAGLHFVKLWDLAEMSVVEFERC